MPSLSLTPSVEETSHGGITGCYTAIVVLVDCVLDGSGIGGGMQAGEN